MKAELIHLLDRLREEFPGFTAIHFSADPASPVRVLAGARIHNFESLDHLQRWTYGHLPDPEPPPTIRSQRVPGAHQTRAVDLIIQRVAEAFVVDESHIQSSIRTAAVSRARHVCMVLARELLSMTSTAVAAAFDRDHGTVLHAEKAIKDAIETETETRKLVEGLRGVLKNELEHLKPSP